MLGAVDVYDASCSFETNAQRLREDLKEDDQHGVRHS